MNRKAWFINPSNISDWKLKYLTEEEFTYVTNLNNRNKIGSCVVGQVATRDVETDSITSIVKCIVYNPDGEKLYLKAPTSAKYNHMVYYANSETTDNWFLSMFKFDESIIDNGTLGFDCEFLEFGDFKNDNDSDDLTHSEN